MTAEEIQRISAQSFTEFLNSTLVREATQKLASPLDKQLLRALLAGAHSAGFQTSAKIYWTMISEDRERPERLDG